MDTHGIRKEDHELDRTSLLTQYSYREKAENRARALAYISFGIGLAELAVPGFLNRLIGVPNTRRHRNVLRVMGIREIASGAVLLSRPSAGGLWARVAGDLVDLGLMARAFGFRRTNTARLATATAAVAGIALVDASSGAGLSRGRLQKLLAPIHVAQSITIFKSPEEVYSFFRDLENLPRFMAHLESVKVDNGRSTWKARGPAGMSVEWQAQIVLDRPNESLGWRSVEGTRVPNQGVVRFKPAPYANATEVHVELKYDPPLGKVGAAFAKLFGEEPSQQIKGDLRRLKQVLETGEVVHSDSSIHRGMHPARPSKKKLSPEGDLR